MIAIFDTDQPLETRRCRLVQLPDGRRAAFWRGLAWPISDGNRIDAAGEAHPLLAPHLPAPASPFGVIDGAEEAWVILDGPVSLRDAAAAALRRSGISVLRSGPWLGDPVDGVHGTGFVRLVKPQTDDLRQTLATALAGTLSPATAKPNPADRVRALTIELMEVRAELARIKLAQTEQRSSAAAGIEAELLAAREENLGLVQEIAELRLELAEATVPRPEPDRLVGRLQDEIATFVAALRPDLFFLRDSMTVLAGEFSDRRGLYRALLELNADTLGRQWKVIRGAPGWWERHVSNGRDDAGRLYARPVSAGWQLLVSHKAQQLRDVRWLAGQPAQQV